MINKQIKDRIDNLEVGTYLADLDKWVTDTDGELFEIDNKVWLDYGEMFDMFYEEYIDNEQDKGIQNNK